MTEPAPSPRKPPGLAWESFVERRIREALAAGAFDNLTGCGQPIPGIDDPLDDDWWIKQKLRDEGVNVLPPILAARLDRERTLESLAALTAEVEVRRVLTALNERLRTAQLSAAAGPVDGVAPVDIDATIKDWQSQRRAD